MRWAPYAIALFFGAAVVLPLRLTDPGVQLANGIAPAQPSLSTYSLVLLLGAGTVAITFPSWRGRAPATAALFAGYLLVVYAFAWQQTPYIASGMLQLLLGVSALFVGATLGAEGVRSERGQRTVVLTVLAIGLVELAVASAQRAGIPINTPSIEASGFLGQRANGTLNHPNNLGKAMWLMIIVALAFVRSGSIEVRRLAWLAVGVSFVPLAMGEGRAAVGAAVLTLVTWSIVVPKDATTARVRIMVPIVLAVLLIPFIGPIANRLQSDPEGGARPELTTAAIKQIARQPLSGTGPNAFVMVVRDYDSAVAQPPGYPVHNAFLLTAAELGVVGALLFWLPIGLVFVRAAMSRRLPGVAGGFAVAVTASAPGTYLINSTGWGMLSGQFLLLWLFILGTAYSLTSPSGDTNRPPLRSPVPHQGGVR